ncbi:hypothetical protein, partial [Microbacterium sp. GbtcB4]|uniref:hypothetical protein n=1 Tax=Microbacterium sp. GbtcB4 TaxID=2824749 RepID=UPI001C302375
MEIALERGKWRDSYGESNLFLVSSQEEAVCSAVEIHSCNSSLLTKTTGNGMIVIGGNEKENRRANML